jgi:hypothetical protein
MRARLKETINASKIGRLEFGKGTPGGEYRYGTGAEEKDGLTIKSCCHQ